MGALIRDGHVTLNAEGKQYTASFHLAWGVITVTSGSVSRVIQVGGEVVSPQALARTILKTMVRDNPQDADESRWTLDHRPVATED